MQAYMITYEDGVDLVIAASMMQAIEIWRWSCVKVGALTISEADSIEPESVELMSVDYITIGQDALAQLANVPGIVDHGTCEGS